MRTEINLNSGWMFHEGDLPEAEPRFKSAMYHSAKTVSSLWGPASPRYTGSDWYDPDNWEPVTLPHDYTIRQTPCEENNDTLGYFRYPNAWYRRTFRLPEEDSGKRLVLLFEGIATHSTVWVNGCLIARCDTGAVPVICDVTDYALFGEKDNLIAVHVETTPHESWWYEGAGIYRSVRLIVTEPVSVDVYGVFVRPVKESDRWTANIETTVRSVDPAERRFTVKHTLRGDDGNVLAETAPAASSVEPCGSVVLNAAAAAEDPPLWDVDDPRLCVCETVVCGPDGAELDRVTTRFGFREAVFTADRGFFLNGRPVKIRGVCCHQDYGLTGKAVPANIQRYRLRLLREMGANGYRCSHYPHHPETMDALDEYGFLVMDETRHFDSTPEGLDYLERMIRRDRNHPSVVLWSMGNEEPLFKEERGVRIFTAMAALLRKLDPSRPITAAVSTDPAAAKLMEVCDVIGVNYNLPAIDALHERFPDKPVVSSENCATGTTRGWYYPDCPERGYINALDSSPNSVSGFHSREGTWRFIAEREWLSGGYQWAGIEHRGETRWPRLCSQSGALDLYLQKKDAWYQNKAYWTDTPMIHIASRWNQPECEGGTTAVWVYTNCGEAELFQNGVSLGRQTVERPGHAVWEISAQKGELKAVGLRDGAAAAEDVLRTPGQPAALRLTLENGGDLKPGTADLAVLHCTVTDADGIPVPDAAPAVSFFCDGGAVVGTGSDIADHTPPHCPDRRMRAGAIAVAVRPGAGPCTVYAKAEGLAPARITIC